MPAIQHRQRKQVENGQRKHEYHHKMDRHHDRSPAEHTVKHGSDTDGAGHVPGLERTGLFRQANGIGTADEHPPHGFECLQENVFKLFKWRGMSKDHQIHPHGPRQQFLRSQLECQRLTVPHNRHIQRLHPVFIDKINHHLGTFNRLTIQGFDQVSSLKSSLGRSGRRDDHLHFRGTASGKYNTDFVGYFCILFHFRYHRDLHDPSIPADHKFHRTVFGDGEQLTEFQSVRHMFFIHKKQDIPFFDPSPVSRTAFQGLQDQRNFHGKEGITDLFPPQTPRSIGIIHRRIFNFKQLPVAFHFQPDGPHRVHDIFSKLAPSHIKGLAVQGYNHIPFPQTGFVFRAVFGD